MSKLYKQDGVNIDAGDHFSKFCNRINKSTYRNSHFVKVHDLSQGNFRGPKGYELINLPEGSVQTGGMDGIGTKVVIIATAGNVVTSANNVIAMTAMDISRWGGLPLMFMNTLDVRTLGEVGSKTFENYQQIMYGLRDVANDQGYVLFSGETAELGQCVGSENPNSSVMFNWCGAMLGIYHPDKMILGKTLKPGQVIIVLQDDLGSNGISSVRKAFTMKYGKEWWSNPKAYNDIQDAASPCALYDKMLNTAHGWFDPNPMKPRFRMHLIVHLSGGAFRSKFCNDLLKPLGLSAELNELFEPPEIMKKCADWRGMDDEECYETWNGGQRALVVVDREERHRFLSFAQSYGVKAKTAGMITENKGYTLRIRSKFNKKKFIYY